MLRPAGSCSQPALLLRIAVPRSHSPPLQGGRSPAQHTRYPVSAIPCSTVKKKISLETSNGALSNDETVPRRTSGQRFISNPTSSIDLGHGEYILFSTVTEMLFVSDSRIVNSESSFVLSPHLFLPTTLGQLFRKPVHRILQHHKYFFFFFKST